MDTKRLHDWLIDNSCFHGLLLMFDHDLARAARERGCIICGGKLHSAPFERKPRGVPAAVEKFYHRRLSLCCATDGCRKRTTPSSVRFLGRKVYVAVTVVLISVMVNGGTPEQLAELSREYGADRRTIARWRDWWRATFTKTVFWQGKRAEFAPPVDEARLPGSMLEKFLGGPVRELLHLLNSLTPITGGAGAVLVS